MKGSNNSYAQAQDGERLFVLSFSFPGSPKNQPQFFLGEKKEDKNKPI